MNRRLLVQVTAPAVLIGLLLCGVCLVSAWHVNRLQANLKDILAQNVTSLEAAQELESNVRSLRYYSFLYLANPHPSLLQAIQEDEQDVQTWLRRVEEVANTSEEKVAVESIHASYANYFSTMAQLRLEVDRNGPYKDLWSLANTHTLRGFADLCEQYAILNQRIMQQTAKEGERVSRRLNLTLVLLALGGPLGGVLSGYGISRGLGRSLIRLSVKVQDLAQRLGKDITAVELKPSGDLKQLDQDLQRVVVLVEGIVKEVHTQQREILHAQQLSAVGQLAASVAHDVRNPLTAIKLLVEAALRPLKPKALTTDNLRVMHGEILRLEQTVQGLLDFARPPALQRTWTDFRTLVTRAVELVKGRACQQNVEIVVHCPEEPVVAEVDPGQFTSILVNLLLNAVDAMPQGGELGMTLVREGTDELVLTITDTGCGIEAGIQSQLFTPFVSTKPTGSGLGLSICKRVVEDHGGFLSGANRPEGGACFTIRLQATPDRQ